MARTVAHYGCRGERGAGIALQLVTVSEWEERNGRKRHRGTGSEDSANMAPTAVRMRRNRSPEIPFVNAPIAAHTEKSGLKEGEQLPGNRNNDNTDPVSSKLCRKKRKLRKERNHHVVMEQIKNIVKENEQLRIRLLQLNKKTRSR
ncbi:uncharacterized protein LOC143773805 isoform X2 [Ranitomeya variabilis]|uniref:uncharacterized protein LOC143773805 isoform X2 n=1 Tax=Ranitomeya variabilis TaxID=490064 RepID=UPI004057538A